MLSDTWLTESGQLFKRGLNAPSGAGCFLTGKSGEWLNEHSRLNAPSGAGCFLTAHQTVLGRRDGVLMHLLVLGAF